MPTRTLPSCDALVLGGTTAALTCALSHADKGEQVLLVSPSTYLYEELFRAGDLRLPRMTSGSWHDLLLPDTAIDAATGLVHPDRLKRHGEALLMARGVRLLYACQVIGWTEREAYIAFKSGTYTVACRAVYDCRSLDAAPRDGYLLHVMDHGAHRLLALPTAHPGRAPAAQYARYEAALDALPDAATLARGGTDAAPLDGFDLDAAVAAGLSVSPAAPQLPAPVTDDCDVLVVGGGTAGASAALFCTRQGLRTVLVEMNRQLGGSATVGGVSTYWFGLRGGATAIIDRAVAEARAKHRLPARPGLWNDDDGFYPDLKAHVLLGLCLAAGVDVRFDCMAYDALREDRRVTGVRYAMAGQPRETRARMVLDCTGDGDIAVLAGADYTYGNARDGMTYWGSLAHYPRPDAYKNNFSTMVRVDDPVDYTRFICTGRTLGRDMLDHGSYVAVRESRHIRGLDTVTLEGLMGMAPADDPLYVCYSNYDPKGRLTAELCYFGLLPPNQRFVIPRGAVIPVRPDGEPLDGLLVGGKAISCTHDAFPGIRMQADLQRQGLALAALAGCCVAQDVPARQVQGVAERILALGGDLGIPSAPQAQPLADVIAALTGREPWEWLDAPVTACHTEVVPIIRVFLADAAEAVPLLRARYAGAADPALRLTLARLLLWHRDETGAADVLSAIRVLLDAAPDGLPRRAASTNYGQMLPDHGLMPEAVYLINSLAHAPRTDVLPLMREVLDRLSAKPRDWYDLRAGVYCWCECFGWIALRRHDAALAPLIRRVLALPEMQGEAADPLLNERLHMLSLGLYHALHALGCADGTAGLRRYLDDPRAALREAARQLLAQ